jgi:digeranylgeranylglycerophospholipid reductase
MDYDVAIVGSGPAGLASSIITSSAGLKTIIIEKSSEIGYPIKTSAFTFKEVLDHWNIQKTVLLQSCNSFNLYSAHSKREVKVDFKKTIGGYLDYHSFIRELFFKTIKNGTHTLLEKVIDPIIYKNTIKGIKTVSGKKIQSKIVIDCSGPSAIIGRKMNLLPKQSEIEMGIGIEFEMSNVNIKNQNSINFYVGQNEVVPIGYGWIFPISSNRARVGICTVYNTPEIIEEKNIETWHNKFLSIESPIYNQIKNGQVYEIHKGAYPLCGILNKPYANGLLIAGDSAAQASMLIGEGIRYAMVFGEIAGEVAIESIKQNDFSDNFLATYKKKCDDYLGEYFDVAIDLLKIPTNEYWETLIDSMELFKEKNPDLILKYLKTEMNYNDAKKIFPKLKMNH